MDNLLLEIGAEEIPAGYIEPALTAMKTTLLKKLDDARIKHGQAVVYGTPKRLAVMVKKVAAKQESVTSEVIGPPEKVAFDAAGAPTKAAEKFAEKVGVAVNKLKVKKTEKGLYLSANISERGQSSITKLKEILPAVITALPFPKTMRWADLQVEFARPIHSILAMLGSKVISFQLGNIKSNRYTYGHRFMKPGKIKLAGTDDYLKSLKSAFVLADIDKRKKEVEKDIQKTAKKINGDILKDDELVDINTNLVEYPISIAGKFDDEFLELPDEVLITAMREHQKYFAVIDKKGKLMPYFIAVNNTRAKKMKLVATGHQRVIRARLADAQFFYRSDLELSSDERVKKLKGVLFQAKLGTMYDKIDRVGKIGGFLAEKIDHGMDSGANHVSLKKQVERAARLCKSDLVSQVVVEFPKLQGVMGRVYASIEGELPTVSAAIEEHYRPVYSGGRLPETLTGAVLSIADKIDSICGCFSVGLVPTGASDPYALRRQGIGIVQIMNDKGISFSLKEMITKSLGHFKVKSAAEKKKLGEKIYAFIQNRISHLLAEEGFSKDVISACVSVSVDNIPDVWNRVKALETLKAQPDFEPLAVAFKRVVNILRKSKKTVNPDKAKVDQRLFEHDSESKLLNACAKVERKVADAMKKGLFDQALLDIASLRNDVDALFDGVMVMTDKAKIRNNRLALLGRISSLFNEFADFSKITT